jgi:DNA polymerase III epsilon subunit-like protein
MKFALIDLETTGIDENHNQILELGAVIEDTNKKLPIEKLPKLRCIIKHDMYMGGAFAINMNKRIFEILSKAEGIRDKEQRAAFEFENGIMTIDEAIENFARFIKMYYFENGVEGPINIAGKNFPSFDKLFLEKVPTWKKNVKFERRFIDPAILFVDWKSDKRLPSLDDCLKRAGIDREVQHDAVQDCIDVLLCLRTQY